MFHPIDVHVTPLKLLAKPRLLTCMAVAWCLAIGFHCQAQQSEDLPVVFEDDFELDLEGWKILDPDTWKVARDGANSTLEITARGSAYKPPVRSPLHVALIDDKPVGDFVLDFRVRSTKDSGNHRDCCVFFGFQDAKSFYYVHLGAKPDRVSGQMLLVQDAPRTPLTKNTKPVAWDDKWHHVRLSRDLKDGLIRVYFDDMQTPHLELRDGTFKKGLVGIGSFDDCNEFDDVVLRGR